MLDGTEAEANRKIQIENWTVPLIKFLHFKCEDNAQLAELYLKLGMVMSWSSSIWDTSVQNILLNYTERLSDKSPSVTILHYSLLSFTSY